MIYIIYNIYDKYMYICVYMLYCIMYVYTYIGYLGYVHIIYIRHNLWISTLPYLTISIFPGIFSRYKVDSRELTNRKFSNITSRSSIKLLVNIVG